MFGLPIAPERKRGRPEHSWTLENSNKVNLLFACGRRPIEISRVLGISKPTFYKHYFNEIANAGYAPLMMKARQLQRLNDLAEQGNVAAEKALAAMIHAEQVRAMSEHIKTRGDTASPAPKLGKKEERQEAANAVQGRFAPRDAPPSLLMN